MKIIMRRCGQRISAAHQQLIGQHMVNLSPAVVLVVLQNDDVENVRAFDLTPR